MFFYSTKHISPKVDFKEATIRGLAPDKGLYFPEHIPALPESFLKNLDRFTNDEIAFKVILPYVGNVIAKADLQEIVSETITFDFPLKNLRGDISTLELFHGPTYAFKDVGARFMSRCLAYFVQGGHQKLTVLVATSGDTGGAVANGFYEVPGVDVVILYPSGKVSKVQELQLTTLGKNITALEIEGTFDDCQNMVKEAFADAELQKKLFMTSANSINIARWLPQQFYYFFACKQWERSRPPVISVPSGNFGNISAGLLAYRSGLAVSHFIAACNANDVVSAYINTGNYLPKKSIATISNAMDVGDPSNFVRLREMFGGVKNDLSDILSCYSISDEETMDTLKKVYEQTNYLLDPHGAVGYSALERYLYVNEEHEGIFLETAHPIKFYDVIEPIIEQQVPYPPDMSGINMRKKESIKMDTDFQNLKDFLLVR